MGRRIIQAGKDLGRSLAQLPAQSRVCSEMRPCCWELYPIGSWKPPRVHSGLKTFREKVFSQSVKWVKKKRELKAVNQEFLSDNGIFLPQTPMSSFCTVLQNTDFCFLFLVKSLVYGDGSTVHGRNGNTVRYKRWPNGPWLVFNNKKNNSTTGCCQRWN